MPRMEFLKRYRLKHNLTRYEMALRLSLNPPNYYNLEDASRCELTTLCLIRAGLKLTWEDLGQMLDKEFLSAQRVEKITISKAIRKVRGRPKKEKK